MDKCPCGDKSTHVAWLPSNVYSGIKRTVLEQPVCDYHAEKARKLDVEVQTVRDYERENTLVYISN